MFGFHLNRREQEDEGSYTSWISTQIPILKTAYTTGAVKLEYVISVKYRQCLRIDEAARSQDHRIKVRDGDVLIQHRGFTVTQVRLEIVDRIWSSQKIMINHVSDLHRNRPEEGTFYLLVWLDRLFRIVDMYAVLLCSSVRHVAINNVRGCFPHLGHFSLNAVDITFKLITPGGRAFRSTYVKCEFEIIFDPK